MAAPDPSSYIGATGADALNLDSTTLSPLPPVLHHGLAAVAVVGLLSTAASTALLAHLVIKLLRWLSRPADDNTDTDTDTKSTVMATRTVPATTAAATTTTTTTTSAYSQKPHGGMFVPAAHLVGVDLRPPPLPAPTRLCLGKIWARLRREPPNQFLVLILNLLAADVQQGLAFALNTAWLARDGIMVGTEACWAQGWFVSVGDLASSVFITAIAAHTYAAVVRDYQPPTWAFNLVIAALWGFVYLMAVLGVVVTRGRGSGAALYTRAGAWCWINSEYQDLRLALHYLWIFIGLALTSLIYVAIFFRAGGWSPMLESSRQRQHAFLVYPLIYVVCTTPLAAGRIASMAGSEVPLSYFCLAGALIACNGWLDCLIYSTTRRTIVFGADVGAHDAGLATFAFVDAGARPFGNIVVVEGGLRRGDGAGIRGGLDRDCADSSSSPTSGAGRRRGRGWRAVLARVGWHGGGGGGGGGGSGGGGGGAGGGRRGKNWSTEEEFSLRAISGKESGMGLAIQCDMTTSVAVEDAAGRDGGLSRPTSVRSGY